MPCYDIHFAIMSFKTIDFLLHLSNVKYFDFVIARSSQEPVSIERIPSYLINRIIVCFHQVNNFSTTRIPNSDVLIFTACEN